MVRSFFRPLLAAGLVVAVASCRDSSNPAESEGGLLASRGGQAGPPADLPSASELDRQIPGFGGFYLDDSGNPTIFLTRGSARASAERVLAGYLAARGLDLAALKVQEASYGWQDLERWKGQATMAAFEVQGTVFVDNDESQNRVVVGVENLNAGGQVRAALTRAGLSEDAVLLQETKPIVQVATLRDVSRPVVAGVQIHFGQYVCSVGFNATDGTQQSFVTASHCTNTQGGVEGTVYYQPLSSVDGTVIATEVEDPIYVRGGPNCPRGRKCRYSDASRAQYANPANQGLGLIAKTDGENTGSLTLDGTFSIGSNDCATLGGCLAKNDVVNKVGRTTGWTSGKITATCVNTGVQGSSIVQLCQTFVDAGVAGGDSGSDVFQGTSNVKLAGILWGGSSDGKSFVYSPLANVFSELGTLTTH